MPVRESNATWTGSIQEGSGQMRLGSGAYEGSYDVPSRFEEGAGTNPEELIAAAHAGCFSMALSSALSKGGFTVNSIRTTAAVSIEQRDGGWAITRIALSTTGDVDDIDEDTFLEHARTAKDNCPVSKALASVPEISLEAELAS